MTLAIRFIPNAGRAVIYAASGRTYRVTGTTIDIPFPDADTIDTDQATRLMVVGTTADRPANVPGEINWPLREMYDTTLGAPIFLVPGSTGAIWVNITGSAATSSLPTPTGITFVTTTTSLPDNSPAGTAVATFSVSMSDGSAFSGTLGASPAGTVAISGGTWLVLARALTSADDGPRQWIVAATQNGVTVSGSIQVQVNAISPPPGPPDPSANLSVQVVPAGPGASGALLTDASGNLLTEASGAG